MIEGEFNLICQPLILLRYLMKLIKFFLIATTMLLCASNVSADKAISQGAVFGVWNLTLKNLKVLVM